MVAPKRKAATAAEGPEYIQETDGSLVEAARAVFNEDILSDIDEAYERASRGIILGVTYEPGAYGTKPFGRPETGDMITVRGGGLYLPVRRRVVWMRGEPQQHPDWTIDTAAEKVIEGTFKGGKVEGGYARYRANVFDTTGRLIATGTKTEYSERFLDFVEKAETGAIGRALAIAGYGTEAAADLDEGLDKDRIADAPVHVGTRPINITASDIPGVRVGGRPAKVTEAQVKEIARLSRALRLGSSLIPLVEAVSGTKMPPLDEAGDQNTAMLSFLRTLSFEQGGDLVQRLTLALKTRQEEAAHE